MIKLIVAKEYRLVIPGKPESFRSRHAKKFKLRIKEIAQTIRTPIKDSVLVFIDYFHYDKRNMDVDNITKCVLDALNGIAYHDDKQVINQYSRSHRTNGYQAIDDLPVEAILPLMHYSEYLFIRIRTTSTKLHIHNQ